MFLKITQIKCYQLFVSKITTMIQTVFFFKVEACRQNLVIWIYKKIIITKSLINRKMKAQITTVIYK